MTVPVSVFGSTCPMSLVSATIEAYSVPWLPATKATTFPGFAPLITATETVVAASVPRGTCSSPYAVVPRAADAVPTVIVTVAS